MPLYADPAPGALSLGPTNPIDTTGAELAALPGTALPEKRPGLLGRIMQQPGGNKALLAFGAQLLSDPNFFSGFGKGAMAYQNTLDAEHDKTLPQLVGKGEFTAQRDPTTGQMTFQRTPVADYADDQIEARGKASFDRAVAVAKMNGDVKTYGIDKTAETAQRGQDFKDRWEKADNDTSIRVANIQAAAARDRARLTASAANGKPPSAGVLKTYDEYSDKVSAAEGTLSMGENVMSLINDGTLDLGLVGNLRAKASQATGIGANDSTRAYAQLQQFTQQLVNATLMDARGVQTDGDAERAKIMSYVSAGDTQGAMAELRNATDMIRRARDHNAGRAAAIADQYGVKASAPAPSAAPRSQGRGGSLRQKYGLE